MQWAHEQKKSNYEKIANLHKTIKTTKHKSKVEVNNLQVGKYFQLQNRLDIYIVFFMYQERDRICEALEKETLPDFFLKFGLVTTLIEDVGAFKRKMKIQNPRWRKKRLRNQRNRDGTPVKGDKYFLLKSKGLQRTKQIKSNHLKGDKFRARNEENYMVNPR